MKNIFFQVKYDFINGIIHQWKKFLVLSIIYLVIIADFVVRYLTKGIAEPFSIGDLVLWVYKGMEPINEFSLREIEIPTAYILPNIFIAFIIGDYVFKDINGYGGQILIRSRNKKLWWGSKCLWSIFVSICTQGILFLEMLAATVLFGRISINANEKVCKQVSYYNLYSENIRVLNRMVIVMLITTLITIMAITMTQILISQIFGPVIGCVFVVVIFMTGIFFDKDIFIGNAFMAIRNSLYTDNGINSLMIILTDLILIITSCVCSYYLFEKSDILNGKEWRI